MGFATGTSVKRSRRGPNRIGARPGGSRPGHALLEVAASARSIRKVPRTQVSNHPQRASRNDHRVKVEGD